MTANYGLRHGSEWGLPPIPDSAHARRSFVTLALAIGIFVGALALIASERVDRTKVALLGARCSLLTQTIDQDAGDRRRSTSTTLGLLAGMMLVVRLTETTGVYTYVAIRAGQLSSGRPFVARRRRSRSRPRCCRRSSTTSRRSC